MTSDVDTESSQPRPGATIEALIALARRSAAALGEPRAARLVMPPPDAQGRAGEFCALALDSGDVGLAFVLYGDARNRLSDHDFVGPQAPRAAALAARLASGDAAQRALALAALNALSQALMRRAGIVPPDAVDSFGGLDPQPGETLGMVGFFPPLARYARERGIALTVLERRAELERTEPGLRVSTDRSALANCDKVLCTSSVLLNDTLDDVLAACAPGARVAIVGPSAGCLPDPLFARGVCCVAGTRAVDAQALLERIATGAPWEDAARKYAIRADQWPGAASLLERGVVGKDAP